MEYIVKNEDAGERLDVIVSKVIPKLSRSQAQKLIENNKVIVNMSKSKISYKVKEDDVLSIEETMCENQNNIVPEKIDIDVLYEDDDIIVVNKPKNMVVHPAVGNYTGTLVNAILGRQIKDDYCEEDEELSDLGGDFRPRNYS